MGIANSKAGLQRRTIRDHEWTVKKRAVFLDMLGATCNVSAAARAAGMAATNAYALQRRDAEFAQLWREVFIAGRERLHEAAIACAMGQMPTGDNPDLADLDQVERAPVAFDFDKAITVLKLQGGFGDKGRPVKSATPAEIDAALMERLEQLAKQRKPA